MFFWSLLFCVGAGSALETNFGYQGLTEVPPASEIPSDTTDLILRNNKITYVPEGALCHITGLNRLLLLYNQLTALGNLSCVGDTLTQLHAQANPLKVLPASAFVGLSALEHLYVSHTQLTAFPELWEVAGNLKTLHVHSNPGIGGLPPTETLQQLTSLQYLQFIGINQPSFPNLSFAYDTLLGLHLGAETWVMDVDVSEINKFTQLTTLTLINTALTSLPIFDLPDLVYLDIGRNDMSGVPDGSYRGYPNLQTLNMAECSLTKPPDLSAFSGTLRLLTLNRNQLQHISREYLCQFPNINNIRLYETDVPTIPCHCGTHLLQLAYMGKNDFTAFPRIASCATNVHLMRNAMTHIRSASAATLRNMNVINLQFNPLQRFEDIIDLERNPSAHVDIQNIEELDLCKCEHVWLKIAKEMGARVLVTDAQCGDSLWSALSSSQLLDICDPSTLSEAGVSANSGWSVPRAKAASCTLPVSAYHPGVLRVRCAHHCLSAQGRCAAYKFRVTEGRYGNCQLLEASAAAAASATSIPDVDESGWECFTVSPHVQ